MLHISIVGIHQSKQWFEPIYFIQLFLFFTTVSCDEFVLSVLQVMGNVQDWSVLALRRKETSVLTLRRVVSTAGLSYE